ncbi:centrosomal protein of 192 kDa isoform X2 [Parasteatoda tepidariorum]|uniref:centrosomal protein of 192 kDa isoform X2 n=1 Tax=Parasteatoda tepidariorum TaxID=114398 RepID=UPI001C722A27|nr:centrosomal protein of 192 kDa isoform X2 [Parasteatoda tepidariorum]
MEDQHKGFLDDTSISKTPRSPLLSSTATKINCRNFDAKNKITNAMNSFTMADAALNEITNIAPLKYKFDKMDSFTTEANSSLGILHMDNFSDFTDTSLTMPENILKSKKKLRKSKLLSRQNNVHLGAESVISNAAKSDAVPTSEVDRESSSDIEYDGTNIPELNFDCDISIPTGETGNNQANDFNVNDECSEKISEFLQSLNIENKSSIEARESIFNTLEPAYESLFKESEDKELADDYIDFKSPVVDSILLRDQLEEETFLQNLKKLSSSQIMPAFCPDEISARSSSLGSPTDKLTSFSSSVNIDSCFDDPKTGGLLDNKSYDTSCYGSAGTELSVSVSATSPYGSFVSEKDLPCNELGIGLDTDNKLGASNFFSTSNLFSSTQFGISDSEFMKPDEVNDLLREDEEALRKEQMFEISSVSKSSESSDQQPEDSSTISWNLELQNSHGHQVSIGALFGPCSENVGTLSDDSHRERPYFGTTVSTPTKCYPDISKNSNFGELSAEISGSTMSAMKSILSSESIPSESSQFCRDIGLSDILEGDSTFRPSRLASKIFENYRPVHNSTSNVTSHSEKGSQEENGYEILNSVSLTSATPSPNDTLTVVEQDNTTIQNSPISRNQSLVSPSVNSTLTELRQPNDNPLLNISNSDAVSDAGIKMDVKSSCPNCQFSFQNTTSSTRPSSSCSNCPSIQFPNHPVSVQTQNFLNGPSNCFHNGMLYNATYGAVQPPMMSFISPLQAGLSRYNPYHLQGLHNINSVQGPEELHYPEKLSIGITKLLKLPVQNMLNVPCFYEVSCVAATVDDMPVTIHLLGINLPPFVKCNDGGATEIEITLSPNYEGKIRAELSVGILYEKAVPLKTTLKYEVLRPSINISSKGKDSLNLGPVIAGSTVIEYVTVENASEVTVPIHLNLSNGLGSMRVSFCDNQLKHQKGVKIVSPTSMFYEFPRSHSGLQASRLDIPFVFEAGNSDLDVNFTLTAAIEKETTKEVLSSFIISASVRVTRLVLSDPSQNPLRFHIREGIVLKKSLMVRNQGPLHVTYDLHIEEDPNTVSVFPSTLSLQPSETATIFITFSSSIVQEAQYSLKAAAQPHGQVFKVVDIFGSVRSIQNPRHSLPREQPGSRRQSHYECKNIVEVNKKYLAWGGVDIGLSVMKNFTLRNALSRPLRLKLFVKEASQSFQLLNQNNETSQTITLDLEAKEEKPVSVVFSPNMAVICSGILGIRPTYENTKTSFSIPVSGYGGLGKLKVLGIPEREGIGYCLDMAVTNGKLTFYNIHLQNTGARAIFVKIVLSSGGADNYTERISVRPSEFVMMENENKVVVISCTFSANFLSWNSSNLGIMTLIYGDEIMRQQLRRYEVDRKQAEVLGVDYYPGIKFTSYFEEEEKVPTGSLCQSTPKDASLFASNLKKTIIHLNPVSQDMSYSRINFEALSTIENGFASILGQSATFSKKPTTFLEAHSPPQKESAIDQQCRPQELFPFGQLNLEKDSASVKNSRDSLIRKPEEQSSSAENSRNSLIKKSEEHSFSVENKGDNWTIKPEELYLDSSSKDVRIAVTNHSKKDLKFRVECPIDVITISPLSGIVPAQGEIGLRCRVIPNSIDKNSFNGDQYLRIICGSSEKSVHVKIALDPKKQKETLRLSLNSDRLNSSQTRTSQDSSAASSKSDKTGVASPVRNIIDFPKEITLPTTEPGDTSETSLAFQNTTKNSAHWKISAATILFSETFENNCSGDILKIHPTSGVLNTMETCTVIIRFSPISLESYSQFFQFCIESENEQKEKCDFKISGKGAINIPSSEEKVITSLNSNIKGTSQSKNLKTGVYLESDICKFLSVSAGKSSHAYVTLKNFTDQDVPITIIKPRPPFSVRQSSVIVRSKKFLKIPFLFKPTRPVQLYEDDVIFQRESCDNLILKLKGFCF